MQGYCLNCSNISKYVRGEFHGKIVKTVGIFLGQSNFLTITPSEWRLGKKFKQFLKNLLPLMGIPGWRIKDGSSTPQCQPDQQRKQGG